MPWDPEIYGYVCFCVFGWIINSVVEPSQKHERKHNTESFARKRTLNHDFSYNSVCKTVCKASFCYGALEMIILMIQEIVF